MSDRALNFSAGPGTLPEQVLKQIQHDIWDIDRSGIGIMEHSHRGKVFDKVLAEAEADCRAVGSVPDNYRILFLQGGASTQFFQVPANLLPEGQTADYFDTGKWAADAIKEGVYYGNIHVAFSSKDSRYDRVPDFRRAAADGVNYSDDPVYVHYTSNNTIAGTQVATDPENLPGNAYAVCDASSDIFSRPIDISKYGLIYAGAQKNLGPAGMAVVIVREDLLEKPARELPTMLRYAVHAEKESRYNTPPTTAIYVAGQVFKWLLQFGGLEKVEKYNRDKAALIYEVIDSSDFYRGCAQPQCRSQMNITFRLPSEDLEEKFIAAAGKHRMSGLKGHRSVGGIRASIYNAFPAEHCKTFAEFMRDFEAKNG